MWTTTWYPFIQRLLETVKDTATSVTEVTELVDGVSASWTLSVNVNNRVTGFLKLDGTATSSTFAVMADKFIVVSPSNNGLNNTAFTVGNVNGTSTVGIRADQIIIDGTIQAYNIAANAITADKILAGAVTTDKLTADNVDVLDGTFGTLRTNATSTRVQITDATNDLVVYASGNVAVRAGATNSAGSLEVYSANSALYPAYGQNTSTTGGDLSTGGGAAYFQSVGGYALQAVTTTTGSAAAINAANTGTSGGQGQIGRSNALGGWAFYTLSGGYGPFTGAHDALIPKSDASPEIGDIMIDGDVYGKQLSDVLTEVSRSNAPAQLGALGVLVHRYPIADQSEPPPSMWGPEAGEDELFAWWDLVPTHDLAVVNSVGEGCINVCGDGGNISKGDLLVTSSMPGKGMRQSDDIVRAATVAKARESVTFSDPSEVKLVACIYLCG